MCCVCALPVCRSADKTTTMQVTLEALIDKRLNHVDNKIKDLEYSMSSLYVSPIGCFPCL